MGRTRAPKIRVGIPCANGYEPDERVKASIAALRDYPGFNAEIIIRQGASISMLRNMMASADQRVRQTGLDYDYYMCIDTDIVFRPEHIAALIARNCDIVSGAYQHRGNTDCMAAGTFSAGEGLISPDDDLIPWEATGLKDVDWVGAGFLLIKKEVLEVMEYPWFREEIVPYEVDGVTCAVPVGEDVGFCMAARRAGFKIHVDRDVKVEHLIDHNQQPQKKEYDIMSLVERFQARRQELLGALIKTEQEVERLRGAIAGYDEAIGMAAEAPVSDSDSAPVPAAVDIGSQAEGDQCE